MCLREAGQITTASRGYALEFEPRALAYPMCGQLVAVSELPAAPEFLHFTLRERNGHGVEVIVPTNLLVYVHCKGGLPQPPEPRNRNLST
jgi:hypothetical protein